LLTRDRLLDLVATGVESRAFSGTLGLIHPAATY
jgi:hypothetical protein